MKRVKKTPVTLVGCTLAALVALAWLPSPSFAQTKGDGASKLVRLKPVTAVADLRTAGAGDPVATNCPKCKAGYATVLETSFKAATHDKPRKTARHLCEACETKIVTQGRGKAARDMAVHTCQSCGGRDVSCSPIQQR